VLGLRASYGFARQRTESCRSDVDQHLKATISHKKQEQGVRSLDGLAKQAQLSSADMLVYAMANEELMQQDAFHGWHSRRHSVVNVRVILCGLSSSHVAPVARCKGEALLSGALYHVTCRSGSCSARCSG
jgi:hypothetical protein